MNADSPPAVVGDIDLREVERVVWRALCQHHVSERELTIAATIARKSYGEGMPYLEVEHQIEIAQMTGFSKGNVHDICYRLMKARALVISPDARIYAIIPPSRQWPWLFVSRFKTEEAAQRAAELEAARGPKQPLLFPPDEFAEALKLERMRAALIAHHQSAITRQRPQTSGASHYPGGHINFPVKDREPKPAPCPTQDKCSSEPTRPPGTAGESGDITPPAESFSQTEPPSSYFWHPNPPAPAIDQGLNDGNGSSGFPNREPEVPEKGTAGSQIGNSPLSALSVLMSSECTQEVQNTKALSAFSAGFPNREPDVLDPGADEAAIIKHLQHVLGVEAMERWGGWWRLQIRECRRAVIETTYQYRLRVLDPTRKPVTSPGGWLRDQYFRFRRVIKAEKAK